MKELTNDQLICLEGGGNSTVAGICAGLAIGRFAALALSIAVPGGAAVWLTVGAICAANYLF